MSINTVVKNRLISLCELSVVADKMSQDCPLKNGEPPIKAAERFVNQRYEVLKEAVDVTFRQ